MITDNTSSQTILEKPVKRVMPLAPHITKDTYSSGASELLVGNIKYANYPSKTEPLPRMRSYNKLNIEAIAVLKHFFEKIKQLGTPLYLDEPNTIVEIAQSIRNPGIIITGNTHKAFDHSLARWKGWPNMIVVRHDNLFAVNVVIASRHPL